MPDKDDILTAYADIGADRDEITDIADKLGIRVIFGRSDTESQTPVLKLDEDGLALSGDGMEMRGDFARMQARLKAVNLRGELLVRAARLKNADGLLTAVDATAGMGEDALLLAASGFSVTLFERNPYISALLKDTLRRAAEIPELKETIGRMKLTEGDSLSYMAGFDNQPDIIYLDPMFPERRKSSLVKKKFQLLHYLEQPCDDEKALINAAIGANPRRIIIKRPSKAAYLAGIKPSYSIDGKGIRMDCIVLHN